MADTKRLIGEDILIKNYKFYCRFTRYDFSADLSARQRRSANLACILTADERPIHGNENRSDSTDIFLVGPTLREKPPCQSKGMEMDNAHKY